MSLSNILLIPGIDGPPGPRVTDAYIPAALSSWEYSAAAAVAAQQAAAVAVVAMG